MPSIRIEPTPYLEKLRVEYKVALKEAGILQLIDSTLSTLFDMFKANTLPEDPLDWAMEYCGIPPADPKAIEDLEKKLDKLSKELFKYKYGDQQEDEHEKPNC